MAAAANKAAAEYIFNHAAADTDLFRSVQGDVLDV
jgi:hypothetical protein